MNNYKCKHELGMRLLGKCLSNETNPVEANKEKKRQV